MASRKKPQSLNDSHYRLLQDLTTPRPPKPSSSAAFNPGSMPPSFCLDDEEEESVPNVKLGQNRDISDDSMPRFSMISDSDSPAVKKPGNAKMEPQHPPRKVIFSDDESDEQSRASVESEISDTTKKDMPVKVKVEGRRRLCKISASDDDSTEKADDQKFSELTDFDSPVVPRHSDGDGNGNEDSNSIRDILNNLSSRLDLLSIERKRVPKDSGAGDCKQVKIETINDEKEVAVREYATAGSSFSAMRDLSDEDESQICRNKTERVELRRVEPEKVGVKARSVVSHFQQEDEESDSGCVLLSGKDSVPMLRKTISKGKEVDDSNIVDVLDGSTNAAEEKGPFVLAGKKFTYKLPRNIATMLYPHQLEGLKWLWFLHCKGSGGILGDDMGLGKTMQICGFLAGLFHSRLIKRALIVAPKTLLPHWIKELSVVGLSEKTREYFGTCPKARQYELQYVLQDKGILLTTYDIVRNNVKSLRGDFYFKDDEDEDSMTWDYMILDEGHLIKNPSTQRAKSLLEIQSAHRIVISGTPIQNNLRELWALFNFCCPNLLGDRKEFKAKYEDLILRGNDKKASEREKRIGTTVAKDLRERFQPYFLRRLKSDVFCENDDEAAVKLSKKSELIVWLRLTSCQRRLYEAYLNSELVLSAFDHSPLAALTILKKICDHPLILTKRAAEDVLEVMEDSVDNPEDVKMAEKLAMYIAADVGEEDAFRETHDSISCKLSFIMSLLENLIPEGHKVLIFSQTRKMLNLVQESLVSNGYNYLRIDGTTKASDRVKVVNEFQEGSGAPIFLLTSQVGGLGLTLTEADRVIVVDPAWNPSTDNQSVDRAYRIGQKKDVIVYRLMTCGTVEEKIYRKQVFKGGLFKTATEHKEQMRYFSQQDLRDLFRLPIEGFDVSPTQQQLHEEHDKQHQMEESLKSHIEFLETLGIAGVSHHSLLYSKTAPVHVTEEDRELVRSSGTTYAPNPSWSGPSTERDVDGAAFAFRPKDVNLTKKNHSPDSSGKLTESDIKERITRLSQILGNKGMIDKLPDKGQKIQRQISELNLELHKLRMPKKSEVIDLDDITGDFDKRLNFQFN